MSQVKRELIVVVDPAQASPHNASFVGTDFSPNDLLQSVMRTESAKLDIRPLFNISPARLQAFATEPSHPDIAEAEIELTKYFKVYAPDNELEGLAAQLRQDDRVSGAYVRPVPEVPRMTAMVVERNPPANPDSPTPDFSDRQGYLRPAPEGVDAHYAWQIQGGDGSGVRIIDMEMGWNFAHEDLQVNEGDVISGVNTGSDHGTAVLGEMGGDHNPYGIKGICPGAQIDAASWYLPCNREEHYDECAAEAIRIATENLRAGDILLLEMHLSGPRCKQKACTGQEGYIPIEWFPDVYTVIRYATYLGILIVEAAGNGSENLDDPLYDIPYEGFPPAWRNPFRRGARDSGAILVGAGAPPPGTHGRSQAPARSRLWFSNYGSAVDVQGWGDEVTTAGYGDLHNQAGKNQDYTDGFGGTSSASPIIAGVLACLQGILRHQGRPLLTPAQARHLLRSTGSPQQHGPHAPATQRIGNLPDLRQLIEQINR